MGNRSLLRNVVDAQFLRGIDQQLDDSLSPVGPVTEQTQVREWFLGTPQLAFFLAEFVGEFDQKFTVTVSLMLGEGKDTSDVVVIGGLLLFREITNNMTTVRVSLALESGGISRTRDNFETIASSP